MCRPCNQGGWGITKIELFDIVLLGNDDGKTSPTQLALDIELFNSTTVGIYQYRIYTIRMIKENLSFGKAFIVLL